MRNAFQRPEPRISRPDVDSWTVLFSGHFVTRNDPRPMIRATALARHGVSP